jgi:hypothetical protein
MCDLAYQVELVTDKLAHFYSLKADSPWTFTWTNIFADGSLDSLPGMDVANKAQKSYKAALKFIHEAQTRCRGNPTAAASELRGYVAQAVVDYNVAAKQVQRFAKDFESGGDNAIQTLTVAKYAGVMAVAVIPGGGVVAGTLYSAAQVAAEELGTWDAMNGDCAFATSKAQCEQSRKVFGLVEVQAGACEWDTFYAPNSCTFSPKVWDGLKAVGTDALFGKLTAGLDLGPGADEFIAHKVNCLASGLQELDAVGDGKLEETVGNAGKAFAECSMGYIVSLD